jgi:hypothetical protein
MITAKRRSASGRGLANLAVKIEADLIRRRQAVTHTTEEDIAALTM